MKVRNSDSKTIAVVDGNIFLFHLDRTGRKLHRQRRNSYTISTNQRSKSGTRSKTCSGAGSTSKQRTGGEEPRTTTTTNRTYSSEDGVVLIMDQRSAEIIAGAANKNNSNGGGGSSPTIAGKSKEKIRSNIPPALNGNVKYASGSSWKNVGRKVNYILHRNHSHVRDRTVIIYFSPRTRRKRPNQWRPLPRKTAHPNTKTGTTTRAIIPSPTRRTRKIVQRTIIVPVETTRTTQGTTRTTQRTITKPKTKTLLHHSQRGPIAGAVTAATTRPRLRPFHT